MTSRAWFIQKIQVFPLQAPLIQPFRTALGSHDTLDNLLFVLTLADGVKGYGEAAVATHITGETIPATRRNLQSAGRWLVGQDVRDAWRISGTLHERWSNNPAMIAAVEMALFDALTRQFGCPLWQLFGPRCRKLQTDITIVIADLAETQNAVQRFYAKGFRQFKVKVGRDFDLDVARVATVRKLAPKGVIYLDANQGFSVVTMLKFLKALKRLKIRPALLEQPVLRADLEGLKRISRSTDIPVCADESARRLSDVEAIIRTKAAKVISVKLMKSGLVEAAAIARAAKAAGLKLMISGMMESPLAMTASAHLAAGLGCFSYIDLDTPFFIRGHAAGHRYLSAKGVYDLSNIRKGIGIIPK
ncbi:MAG: dipeptide epimerase [Candidatus Omnitrophica bacterium]|nr:dipeptide epimerase [Candidatus Omnitrophota bacterium]